MPSIDMIETFSRSFLYPIQYLKAEVSGFYFGSSRNFERGGLNTYLEH